MLKATRQRPRILEEFAGDILEETPAKPSPEAARKLYVPWDSYGKEYNECRNVSGRPMVRIWPRLGKASINNVNLDPGKRYFIQIKRDLSACRIVEGSGGEGRKPRPARGKGKPWAMNISGLKKLPCNLAYSMDPATLEGTRTEEGLRGGKGQTP
ncbi:MAG: hypothetical protein LBO03_04350 [Acidaminococcales bacterium]|nr:hypothetical protein [Acidaminococcales bacterium]